MAEKDYTVRDQVQRLVGDKPVRPRDVRLAGVAFLLGAAMMYGLALHLHEGCPRARDAVHPC